MPLFQNYFNRTTTYRLDSDVVNTYGRIRCIDSSSSCSNFPPGNALSTQISTFNPASTVTSSVQMNLTVQNRTAASFVSNCKTRSPRELLVRNLLNFIPIDVYGTCRNNGSNHTCLNRFDCNVKLGRYYRVYLIVSRTRFTRIRSRRSSTEL